jgi:DNA polymerase
LDKNYLKILKEIGIEEIFMEESKNLNKEEIFQKLNKEIQECKKCDLYKSRKQAVLGEGNLDAKLMFIGEAPGADEDKLGRPFVGRAGKLLTKLIEATGHKREEFYITNINKCRPPNNRTPTPWEQEACFPYLEKQIEVINPKVLCLLGAAAAQAFLKRPVSITKERGQVINYKGKKAVLTLHPAYVLRNQAAEELLFEDIKKSIELSLSD